jgi:ribonuclease HI
VAKTKYYVVWKGRKRGIFLTWAECEKQVKGFVGAEFKSFASAAEARAAFSAGYAKHRGKPASQGKWKRSTTKPRLPSLCADAACSGSPGWLEYRVVETETGQQLLREGPWAEGTNNVGEFLAIVEALRWLRRHRRDWPIYSDSENAILWVGARRCNTKLKRSAANQKLFEMIGRAVRDLPGLLDESGGNTGTVLILKWETKTWGENPADFGRK